MELTTTYLGTFSAGIAHYFEIGETPEGLRRYAVVGEGKFVGPAIHATVLPGGSDALLCTSDDARRPDVRFLMRTDDDAMILVTYQGVRVLEEGKEDYWRCHATFQTAAPKYDWMNRIVTVGRGRVDGDGVAYEFFQVD